MKRILIADPHPIVRLGIKERLLAVDPKIRIVAQIDKADTLLSKLMQKKPGLLIWEMNMPGIHGFSLLKQISTQLPELKICIFSSLPQDLYEYQSIHRGAHAFISKNASLGKFTKTIHELISVPKSQLPNKIPKKTKKLKISLSSREVEVLELLIKGYRNKDIASFFGLNEKTVGTYKSRILEKLEMDNIADLINYYRTIGHKMSNNTF